MLPPIDIDPDLSLASTLPADWYFEERALELEYERVFERSWQFAGSGHALREPGSFRVSRAGREPLLLVRGDEGELRALSNVCRHRAGCVKRGAGQVRALQCSYHGWVYDLDGRLRSAPEFDGVKNFENVRLPEFRLEEWQGLLFVNISGEAPPLAEFFAEVDQALNGRDLRGFANPHRKDWEIACNWKVYVDNYLEGYHIPIVHPQLFRELDYRAYRTETFRFSSIQHAPIRRPEKLRISSPDDQALYFWIYPNLMLNIYPDNFSTNLIVPQGAGRTVTEFEWFFPVEQPSHDLERIVSFSDEIQLEDVQVCEEVQRNLRSRTYSRGRFSVRRENGVHHFHRLLAASIAVDR